MVFILAFKQTQKSADQDVAAQTIAAMNDIAKENIAISLSKADLPYATTWMAAKDKQLLCIYTGKTEAEFDKLPLADQQKAREGVRELLLLLATDKKYVTDLRKSGVEISQNIDFNIGFFFAMHLDPPQACFNDDGTLKQDEAHRWLLSQLSLVDADVKDGAFARLKLEADIRNAGKEELKSIFEANKEKVRGSKGNKKSSSIGNIPPTSPLFIYWPYLADRVSTVELQGLYNTPDIHLSVAVPNYLKLGPVISELRTFGSIIDATRLGDYKATLARWGTDWLDSQIGSTTVLEYLRAHHAFTDDSEATARNFRALMVAGNYPDGFALIRPGSQLYNAFQVQVQLPTLNIITTKISQESMAAALANTFSGQGSVQFVLGRDNDIQVYFDYSTANFQIGSTSGKEDKLTAGSRWLTTIRSLGDLNLLAGAGVTYSKVSLLDLYSGQEYKPFVEMGTGKTIGGDKLFVLADAFYKHIFAKKSPSEDFFTAGVSPTWKPSYKFQISAGPRLLFYKNTDMSSGQLEGMLAGSLAYEILNDKLTLYGSFTSDLKKKNNFQAGITLKLGD